MMYFFTEVTFPLNRRLYTNVPYALYTVLASALEHKELFLMACIQLEWVTKEVLLKPKNNRKKNPEEKNQKRQKLKETGKEQKEQKNQNRKSAKNQNERKKN